MDEEKLINLVRSHECIYDVSSRFYMDQHMKRNAWQKIAEEMNKTPYFMQTLSGTIAVMNNYTFSKHYVVKDGFRWKCSRQFSMSCRAFLVLNDEGTVIRSYNDHNHEPTSCRYFPNQHKVIGYR